MMNEKENEKKNEKKEEKIKIDDESGDKKYFCMLPHFILNHSTAIDQALYAQMKRYAGEDGECFASKRTLMEKLGIGRQSLNKSIKYLLGRDWIYEKGYKLVKTDGGRQKVKIYGIKDIWKEAVDYYDKQKQGASETAHPQQQGASETALKVRLKQQQGASETAPNKNHIQIRTIRKEEIHCDKQVVAGNNINNLIDLFKDVNPSYEKLYKNKTQREAIVRLVDRFGEEKVSSMIRALIKTIDEKYAPTIITPLQLEDKLGALIKFVRSKNPKISKINITTK